MSLMQYTIQNLAGSHPDASEDGKLKYGMGVRGVCIILL